MPIMKYKDPDTGEWVPVRTHAVEGDDANLASSIRTEVTVEAEPWVAPVSTEPEGEQLSAHFYTRDQLKAEGDSDPWANAVYYVTLKGTDGSALESGYFKLCKAIDGYATAVDQMFCLPDLNNGTETIYENMPVDFYSISEDRTTFQLRDAGVKRVEFQTQRPLMKSYEVLFAGRTVCVNTDTPGKYFNISDDFSVDKGGKVKNYVWVSAGFNGRNGVLGYLYTWINGGIKSVAARYAFQRTKNGGVGTYNVICNAASQMRSDTWYQDTTRATDDFTLEPIEEIRFGANADLFYLLNGSSVVLIEE